MEKVSLVARVACPYDGGMLKIGQRFSATPEDARLLTMLELASSAEPDEDVPAYKRADLSPDNELPTTKRAYKRRELTPEP